MLDFQTITDDITTRYGEAPITVTVNYRLRSVAGKANWLTREIEIAGWLIPAPVDAQKETLMHEIAHVMAGSADRGHGKVWKSFAKMLGCTGTRCYSRELRQYNNSEAVKTFYVCEHGECTIKGQRRPRRDYSKPGWYCKAHNARFNHY